MKRLILLVALLFVVRADAQWVQTLEPASGYGANIPSFASIGPNLFVGSWDGVFRSTDNGTSWTQVASSMIGRYVTFAASDTFLFAASSGWNKWTSCQVYLSTDLGTSWNETGWPGGPGDPICALKMSGANLFAGTGNGQSGYGSVFVSTDYGSSWAEVDSGLTHDVVAAFVTSGMNLFVGTWGGVFRSTDNGTSWTQVDSGLGNAGILALAVSDANLFAGTVYGGVFLSTDNGSSWTAVNTGLTNTYVRSLGVSGTNLFAGTWGGGVFLSTNNGTSWTQVNAGLPDTNVTALAITGTYLFAGTYDSGVWRRPLSEVTTSAPSQTATNPSMFTLDQNYPNPFNPSTTIRYELPKTSMVRLSMYDMLGREVLVLVNERKNSGSYEVKFDASELASGVYIYRITASDFVQSRKLVILK